MTGQQRLHARVSGLVQGVGFRYFVYNQARHLGLTGWVRNLMDGRVEVLAEGASEDLEELLAQLHQGPGGSRVKDVLADWSSASGEFSWFSIEHW